MKAANLLRKMADNRLKKLWGCTSDDELAAKKREAVDALRRRNPEFFAPSGNRRKVIEMLSAQSGLSFDEQLEQMAFDALLEQAVLGKKSGD